MRSMRGLWLMLLLLGLGLSCKREAVPPALRQVSEPRVRRTFLQPLAWLGSNRLAFRRVDHVSAGDAGQIMCDSAGIYVLESSDSAGHPQPYSIDSALCSRTGLTDGFAFDPTSRIAYFSDASGTPGIFAFDLTSSKVDALADDCIPTSHPPALLRELHLLAFAGQCTRAATSDEPTIYLVGVGGSNLREAGSKSLMFGDQVTWSPDGGHIAYVVASKSGVLSITVSDTTGVGSHRVAEGVAPAWSPDGDWIAYLTKGNGLDSGHTVIRMVHPDGTGDRSVWQSTPSRELELVSPLLWSLDSESIIVSSSNSLWQVTVGDGSSHALLSIAPQRE